MVVVQGQPMWEAPVPMPSRDPQPDAEDFARAGGFGRSDEVVRHRGSCTRALVLAFVYIYIFFFFISRELLAL